MIKPATSLKPQNWKKSAQPAKQENGTEDPLMRPRKLRSIVPEASVASTALSFVIGIMVFLSSLTLGAVTLVNDSARSWQSDIAREVTIQIRPIDGVDLDEMVLRVQQLAGDTEGVSAVTVMNDEAMSKLLEPWLGSGLNVNQLPVPKLITLAINKDNPPDFTYLQEQLAENVKGASLDDHRVWVDRLTKMARATILIGLIIFLLMMMATVMTVIFATRGAMSGNKEVIEVLHFVGAEQSYIAAQFQKHFLLLGFKGALIGGLIATLCFVLMGWWNRSNVADPTSDQVAALFGTFSISLSGYIGTLLLVFAVAILTAVTSRLTVFRHVGGLESGSRAHQ